MKMLSKCNDSNEQMVEFEVSPDLLKLRLAIEVEIDKILIVHQVQGHGSKKDRPTSLHPTVRENELLLLSNSGRPPKEVLRCRARSGPRPFGRLSSPNHTAKHTDPTKRW